MPKVYENETEEKRIERRRESRKKYNRENPDVVSKFHKKFIDERREKMKDSEYRERYNAYCREYARKKKEEKRAQEVRDEGED